MGSANANAYTSTIYPGFIPDGYFDDDNIEFIRTKIASRLTDEFAQAFNIDRASVIRVMERILGERLEIIPRMNMRVIMSLINEVRNHQHDVAKKLKWSNFYPQSQLLYDASVARGPDLQAIKLKNRLGEPRVGGTTRFYFT